MEAMNHFPELHSDFNIYIFQPHPSTYFDHHKPTRRLPSFHHLHRGVYVSCGHTVTWKQFWKEVDNWSESWATLGDRTVFQCWTITALSENSSFPVLEWLCIFCGGAGCRPNNRPHWLALTFLPPRTVAAVTLVVPGKVAFSAALVNTRCTVDFDPSLLAHHLISQHTQHDLWRLEQMCLLFIFCHTAIVQTHTVDDRIVSQAGTTCQVGAGSGLHTPKIRPSSKTDKECDCLSLLKNGANV